MTSGSGLRQAPDLVSVVVPVFNAAWTIDVALQHLAAQDYPGRWELVLVDNRCTDSSIRIAEQWRDRFPEFRVVPAMDRPGVPHARNVGVLHARGELIAICDADDAATPDWLREIVAGALEHDIVGGRNRYVNELNPHRKHDPEEPEPDSTGRQGVKLGYLPFAQGANFAAWRDVIEAVGGWDEDLVRGCNDVDFSWRAQRLGFTIAYRPTAIIDYRERAGLRALARQRFMWALRDTQLIERYRSDIPIQNQRVSARQVATFPPRLAASVLLRRTPPGTAVRALVSFLSVQAGLWVGFRREWPPPSAELRGLHLPGGDLSS